MYKPYNIIDDQYVELIDGPFKGVVYQYGKVQLQVDQEKDVLNLNFNYNIRTGQVYDTPAFQQFIGDILQELIRDGLMTNNIVYTGGS